MPDPAPPASARAELNASLNALGGNLATAFARPCGFSLPGLPPGMGTAPTWDDREPAYHDAMRRHLDTVNRRLLDIGDTLDVADAALTLAISEHLDGIGLDDLTSTHQPKQN